MKHKLNSKSQAETTDDSSANADTTMSSLPIAKPIANTTVVRGQSRVSTLSDNYINFLRIFSNGSN